LALLTRIRLKFTIKGTGCGSGASDDLFDRYLAGVRKPGAVKCLEIRERGAEPQFCILRYFLAGR
jgi:hypothetical protein